MNATRVACIGDSLTFGYLVENRFRNCYPARLNDLLGESYEVRNFGVNGLTLLKSGDSPYWEHKYFNLSLEFNPHVVIIMLGTNDSKPNNWTTVIDYIRDYEHMIEHYRSLLTKPNIYLLTPPTAFILEDEEDVAFGVSNEHIQKMRSAIKHIGNVKSLPVIDINEVTAPYPECFPIDGVHTNADGANLIATTVYRAISNS